MKGRSIALIGFRATGKSTLGGFLAEPLGWEFVDMDAALVERLGMDIQRWVRSHGWPSFRVAESQLLEKLSKTPNLVVATGGGIVETQANRELLKKHFLVVWLRASLKTILERLQEDPATSTNRPALTQLSWEDEVRTLLSDRAHLYAECSHISVDTDEASMSDLAQRVMEALESAREHAE